MGAMNLIKRYSEALQDIPVPGCGCHPYLLTVSNYGVICDFSAEQIFTDIRRAIPQGTRQVCDGEITDAINKALADRTGGTFSPRQRTKPVVKDGKAALQRIIEQGKISDETGLRETSPVRLSDISIGLT